MTTTTPGTDSDRASSLEKLRPILTVNSVAKLMRVNRKTVYEMVRLKAIPGVVHMGRALRFSRDALLAWLGVQRSR